MRSHNKKMSVNALTEWVSSAPAAVIDFMKKSLANRTEEITQLIRTDESVAADDIKLLIDSNIIAPNVTMAIASVNTLQTGITDIIFTALPAGAAFKVFETIMAKARMLDAKNSAATQKVVDFAREASWGNLTSTVKEVILRSVWVPHPADFEGCSGGGAENAADDRAKWESVSMGYGKLEVEIDSIVRIAILWMKTVFLKTRRIRIHSVLEAAYVEVSRTPRNTVLSMVAAKMLQVYARARPLGISVAAFVFAARRAEVLFSTGSKNDYGVSHTALTCQIAPVIFGGTNLDGMRIAMTHLRIDIFCAFLIRVSVYEATPLEKMIFSDRVLEHCSISADGFSSLMMLLSVVCGWITELSVETSLKTATPMMTRNLRRSFALFDGINAADVLARIVCTRPEMRTLIFTLHMSGVIVPRAQTAWASKIALLPVAAAAPPITNAQKIIAARLRQYLPAGRDERAVVMLGLIRAGVPSDLVTLVLKNMPPSRVPTVACGPEALWP